MANSIKDAGAGDLLAGSVADLFALNEYTRSSMHGGGEQPVGGESRAHCRKLIATRIVGSGRDGRITKADALAASEANPVALPKGLAEGVTVSPLARKLAKRRGIDLAVVEGSGPRGRILRDDLDNAPGILPPKNARPVEPVASSPGAALSLDQMGIRPGSYDLVPWDGMREVIARRLTDSFRDVPQFPLTIDLAIDQFMDARVRINAGLEASGVRVTLTDLVIKAVATALRRVPETNASYTPEGIARHRHADVAIAVALDGGLVTPIVRAAETKGLAEIAAETKDLAKRARARKLRPDEFQGRTFTVSNLGMFGIKSFASIISEPQGAILSVGASEKQPVVRNGKLEIATMVTATLTCDHRAIDGVAGARFLQVLANCVADPIAMTI